jgi:hypothetical protein
MWWSMLGHVGLGSFWRIGKQLVGAAVENAHHHHTHNTNADSWIIEIRGLDCKLLITD